MEETKTMEAPQAAAIGAEQVKKLTAVLQKYKTGKVRTEHRIIASENWWKLRNDAEEGGDSLTMAKEGFKSASGWLHNVIVSKHADAMEAYPEPNILPREEDDRAEAHILTAIIPCVLEQNQFEKTYSDVAWQKIKSGTGVYKVVWDTGKLNGLGDITISKVNLLNLYWEPGITDIQRSRYLFHVELMDRDLLEEQYPALEGKLKGQNFMTAKFLYDDTVSTDGKVLVVECYYHRYVQGRKTVQYVKYVNDQVIFATENDPALAQRGLYDHGMYPYVFDALFPIEGSPCGYGFVDICRNPQTCIDLLNTSFVKNAMAGATPRYFKRQDGGINETEFLDLTKSIVNVNGNLGEDSLRQIPFQPLDGVYVSYACYAFGKDSFGIIDPDGGGAEMIVHDKSEIGGPLNQFSTIGYKFETNGATMAELEQCAALWQKAYDAAGKQAQKAKTAAREGDGEGRYQIRNIDGRLMTVIDTQNDTRDFKAAEAYLKTLVNTDHPFSTILMDAQPVYVGKDLPGEYRSSEYTKSMLSKLRDVKMQAATNLDEMLLLAENGEWRENVKPKHAKDARNGWYRYDTEFAIPILNAKKAVDHYTVYGGTLLIRNDADGKSYLYDLLDVQKKKVISAASFSAETHSEVLPPKPSTDSISTSDEKVNGKFSLKAYSDVEKKQHVKDAKAFFGRTYKWAETGYITTDGARLDFSGKHEGGPGGYRTVDHRDIRDALGDDYGGDDYSGAMVQFMGEGNIRISPESGGINLSVMPTKAQMDTLSDFISKERGEVVLDLDDTNGVTLSSTEYPRGTHSSKVLNDIKAFFETGAVPQVSELGRFRYQLKNFSEQAVSTALYDALSEKATRQNQLIPVSVMPRYISEKLGIGGDIYIQRDHAYENMVSKEQAIQDGRPTQRKGENVHFHDLGVEKMTRAIMSINEPTMTISTKTKDGNPAVIMMLPEYGNNNAPLYAVLSFYSRKTISPENRETRPHVVLTIAERNFFEEGGRYGWADVIKRAINEGTVIDFNKKERSSLSEVAQSVGLGDITDASLKKNLAQFQKEVKQFRESNNIRYQLKSATELEQEVRELKKERRALENRNKVL